ncbi:hypothetical protein BHC57_06670 [Snodgrassella alvi]|uniref:Peptidase C51 domain-containing protein n=1 Tax=Snodgrassella alvi TaxID=1196083 RepID=A0A855FXJ6_9NEIS|nr:hypothetical protein BHC57_06670 [Snodgrassella alvi]
MVDENEAKKNDKYKIYVGESHECVAVVKYFAKAPHTTIWKKGARVKGNNSIRPGTAIATFDSRGKYYGHAAIYINQTAAGINVYDQWNGMPLHYRPIFFKGHSYVSNDGDQFYVIE